MLVGLIWTYLSFSASQCKPWIASTVITIASMPVKTITKTMRLTNSGSPHTIQSYVSVHRPSRAGKESERQMVGIRPYQFQIDHHLLQACSWKLRRSCLGQQSKNSYISKSSLVYFLHHTDFLIHDRVEIKTSIKRDIIRCMLCSNTRVERCRCFVIASKIALAFPNVYFEIFRLWIAIVDKHRWVNTDTSFS